MQNVSKYILTTDWFSIPADFVGANDNMGDREREGLGLMFAFFVDRSITTLVLSYNVDRNRAAHSIRLQLI